MKSRLLAVSLVLSSAWLSGCAGAEAADGPSLDEVREATAKYRDVQVAIAEGYVTDGICTDATEMGLPASTGAMGVHYFRPDLLEITAEEPRVDGNSLYTDFLRPAILIYEPQADGSLDLVAIENLVFIDAWERAGNRQPPSYQNVAFDRMADDPATPLDEAHLFAPHYDRHVWIHRENPTGVFQQWNPAVSCAHGVHMAH